MSLYIKRGHWVGDKFCCPVWDNDGCKDKIGGVPNQNKYLPFVDFYSATHPECNYDDDDKKKTNDSNNASSSSADAGSMASPKPTEDTKKRQPSRLLI